MLFQVFRGVDVNVDSLKRKLTAIFYTDVAGYSRLTGGDEEGTHRRVMEVLDFASEEIESGDGKVLRYAGRRDPGRVSQRGSCGRVRSVRFSLS